MSIRLLDDQTGEVEDVTLEALEEIIGRGLNTFYEVGNALSKVRDAELYKEHAATFDEYCASRWGITARHARRMIDAAEVVDAMGPIGPIPDSEAQARALASLIEDPEAMRTAMLAANEATGGHITAKAITAAVDKLTEEPKPPKPPAPPAPKLSPKQKAQEKVHRKISALIGAMTDLEEVGRTHPIGFGRDEFDGMKNVANRIAALTGRVKGLQDQAKEDAA